MMTKLGYHTFLKGLPTYILAHLPNGLILHYHQPHRWLLQMYDQDKRVHYEVQRITGRGLFEIGLHFESRNRQLNEHMLTCFSRHLFEIHETLGDSVVVEPWDKGWAKLYEVIAEEALTEAFQEKLGKRVADFIGCVHPILQIVYETPVQRRERV